MGLALGFFESSGFYPDFILWIKEAKKQHIFFVEPHGMLHANAYCNDEKAQLHERLPQIAKEIADRSDLKGVTLDSYIVSATAYDDLCRRYENGGWDRERFADAHILFQERIEQYDYIERMLAHFEFCPYT